LARHRRPQRLRQLDAGQDHQQARAAASGIKSPTTWGTETRLAELFPSDEVKASRQIFNFRYRSPTHAAESLPFTAARNFPMKPSNSLFKKGEVIQRLRDSIFFTLATKKTNVSYC